MLIRKETIGQQTIRRGIGQEHREHGKDGDTLQVDPGKQTTCRSLAVETRQVVDKTPAVNVFEIRETVIPNAS